MIYGVMVPLVACLFCFGMTGEHDEAFGSDDKVACFQLERWMRTPQAVRGIGPDVYSMGRGSCDGHGSDTLTLPVYSQV